MKRRFAICGMRSTSRLRERYGGMVIPCYPLSLFLWSRSKRSSRNRSLWRYPYALKTSLKRIFIMVCRRKGLFLNQFSFGEGLYFLYSSPSSFSISVHESSINLSSEESNKWYSFFPKMEEPYFFSRKVQSILVSSYLIFKNSSLSRWISLEKWLAKYLGE